MSRWKKDPQLLAYSTHRTFGPLRIGWHRGRFRAAAAINRILGERAARPKLIAFLPRCEHHLLHFICGPLSIEWVKR